jgi:hypothetical protein
LIVVLVTLECELDHCQMWVADQKLRARSHLLVCSLGHVVD